jgi:hypothetical protein
VTRCPCQPLIRRTDFHGNNRDLYSGHHVGSRPCNMPFCLTRLAVSCSLSARRHIPISVFELTRLRPLWVGWVKHASIYYAFYLSLMILNKSSITRLRAQNTCYGICGAFKQSYRRSVCVVCRSASEPADRLTASQHLDSFSSSNLTTRALKLVAEGPNSSVEFDHSPV